MVPPNTTVSTSAQILNGELNETAPNPCKSDEVLSDHRPATVFYGNDTAHGMTCGWPVLNSVLRIICSLLSLAIAILTFVMAVWKRTQWVYAVTLLMLLAAAGYLYLTYLDSVDVSSSRKWCESGMEGVSFVKQPHTITCDHSPYVGTAIVDPFAGVFFLFAAGFALAYKIHVGPRSLKNKNGVRASSASSTKVAQDQATDDEKQKEDEHACGYGCELVDFEAEHSKRFAPTREKPDEFASLSSSKHKHKEGRVAPGDFDFDFESEAATHSKKKACKIYEEACLPPITPAKEQKPLVSGDMVDFEALADEEQQKHPGC